MESDLNTRSEWGWEIEIPKSIEIPSDEYSLSSGFLDSSEKHGGGFSDGLEEGSGLSAEAMIGLKLGQHTYHRQEKAIINLPDSSSYSPVKRSRASHQTSLLSRCQVEGCDLDLASAKEYHRRHRICADHSKSLKVVVAGMERRFCQQCSRLHDLTEFDDRKRSCRRRLSVHNARRRRPHPEDIKIGSTHRSSNSGFLVNRVSVSSPNLASSNIKAGSADMMSNGDISSSFHRITPTNANHDDGLEANLTNAMEVHHSFSLEPASSWGFRGHEEPSSFDQFIHGYNTGLTQPAGSMPLDMQSNRNITQISHDHFDGFCSD